MHWIKIALISLGVLTANAAAAGECGYDRCWGAVAVGPSDDDWGWSAGYATEQEAVDASIAECPYCDRYYSFFNVCGAISKAPDDAWGSGWGDTQAIAERFATATCEEYGSGCYPVVWACSY